MPDKFTEFEERKIEQGLSSIQSKLANMHDILLAASAEIEELYLGLDQKLPNNDSQKY